MSNTVYIFLTQFTINFFNNFFFIFPIIIFFGLVKISLVIPGVFYNIFGPLLVIVFAHDILFSFNISNG